MVVGRVPASARRIAPKRSGWRQSCRGPIISTLAVAQGQQAKSFELRAASSLVRMWRNEGRRDEGHELLAPIYGWFTEGFDTVDLKEAKALLDQLG